MFYELIKTYLLNGIIRKKGRGTTMLFQDYLKHSTRVQQSKGNDITVEFLSSDEAVVTYHKESIRFTIHKDKTDELQKKLPFSVCVYQLNTRGKDVYEIVFAHQGAYFQQVFAVWMHTTIVEWYANKITETGYSGRFSPDEKELLETVRTEFLTHLEEDPAYRLWFVTNQITIKCS